MGDAGSNFLGFLLGCADGRRDVHARRAAVYSPYGVLAPLLVMAVPLYDMISVILIRLREGRSPFVGDRRHFSHRLVARGLTPPQAVWTIDLVTLAGGLGALLLHRLDGLGACVVLAQTCLLAGGRGHPGTLGEPFGARTMARRGARSSVPPNPREPDGPTRGASPVAGRRPARPRRARCRRDGGPRWASASAALALGLTAALVTARAFWPSEPDLEEGAGAGLYWVLALLVVAGLAIAAGLIGGRFRFRWSWTDAAVVALMVLVAISASHALDRRPAINLAWEWIALGVAYLLVRNLPRTRDESSVLAGALVATAFAVSVYGLYQVGVELPLLRDAVQRNPRADAGSSMGIDAGHAGRRPSSRTG